MVSAELNQWLAILDSVAKSFEFDQSTELGTLGQSVATQRKHIGPPGTGKTTRIIGDLLQSIKRKEHKLSQIIFCSYTNAAVNEARERVKLALKDMLLTIDWSKTNLRFKTIHSLCGSLIGFTADTLIKDDAKLEKIEFLEVEYDGKLHLQKEEPDYEYLGPEIFVRDKSTLYANGLFDLYYKLLHNYPQEFENIARITAKLRGLIGDLYFDTKSPVQSVEEIEIAVEQIKRSEVSTSDSETAGISPKAAETGTIKEILPSKRAEPVSNEIEETEVIEFKQGDDAVVRKKPGRTTYANITLKRAVFHEAAMNIIQNIRSAAPEERENLINELRDNRGTFQTEIVSMSLSIRENAKELRENFRKTIIIKWSRENG
ncbi:MAG: UvrD-helicase domain-containing protein, partial [Candidatus Heimdallarchaeota archaeon]|nr:UvrD-helicase domain-containing protein [Candidatus Heimdallarchaeota archaeon]